MTTTVMYKGSVREWIGKMPEWKKHEVVICAFCDGSEVQMLDIEDHWFDNKTPGFAIDLEYRIKPEEPKTFTCNGFEIVDDRPITMNEGETFYISAPSAPRFFFEATIGKTFINGEIMAKSLIHITPEGVRAHAKAMLGIDPKGEENC